MEFKKTVGKGYDPEEVQAFIKSYEAEFERKNLELECRIEDLSKEIESLKLELIPLTENDQAYAEMEAEIRETLLNLYFESTGAFYKASQGFDAQEDELNQKVHSREMELVNVKQVTSQLCREIELLTQGYDQVLKGEKQSYE